MSRGNYWPDPIVRGLPIPRVYDRWIELAVPGVFEPTSDCSVFALYLVPLDRERLAGNLELRCAGHPQLVAPVSMLMDRMITKLRIPILLAPGDKLEAVLVDAPASLPPLRLCMQLDARYKP